MNNFSKIGFILAVAGSAVGLGNAWKFPYMVGQNGGSAFVFLYLLITFIVGIPIFLAEISIGKLGKADPVSSYENLAPKYKNLWKLVGFSLVGALFIVSFYTVIIGWIVKYTILMFSNLPSSIENSSQIFNNFISNGIVEQIFYFTISFLFCFYVVSKGVKSGIEKLNVYMMPALMILLIIMFFFSLSMSDSFLKSAKFLLIPDFSKISVSSILDALGVSFFTLSVGLGTIITYAASLPDNTNIIKSSAFIVLINIFISIMIGLIVFTFTFEFNATPAQGAGLIFKSLPMLFYKMGFVGHIIGVMFFISLFFAGMTSAVSMVEPCVSYMINRLGFSRKKSLILIGAFVYVLGCICVLSQSEEFENSLKIFGKNFFDLLDFVSSNLIMPISGILASIFIGYVVSKDKTSEFLSPYLGDKFLKLWFFVLKFVAPVCIIIIMFRQIL